MPFKCSCGKPVYANDKQLKVDGRAYHSSCALCRVCKIPLSLNNFAQVGDSHGEESFLLCKKHYSDHFIHATENGRKATWQKSVWKGKTGCTYESEERNEIAEDVFLLSRYRKDVDEFIFQVENTREEAVYVDIDFSESKNFQCKDPKESLDIHMKIDAKAISIDKVFTRAIVAEAYHIELSALIQNLHEKSASTKGKGTVPIPGIQNERHYIADDVYLIAKYFEEAKDFSFHIENHREQPLTVRLDFSESVNLKVKTGFRSATMKFHCDGIFISEEKYVVRINSALEHDMVVSVIVGPKESNALHHVDSVNCISFDPASLKDDSEHTASSSRRSSAEEQMDLPVAPGSRRSSDSSEAPRQVASSLKDRISMFSKADAKVLLPKPSSAPSSTRGSIS
jgi:hypothetical protein